MLYTRTIGSHEYIHFSFSHWIHLFSATDRCFQLDTNTNISNHIPTDKKIQKFQDKNLGSISITYSLWSQPNQDMWQKKLLPPSQNKLTSRIALNQIIPGLTKFIKKSTNIYNIKLVSVGTPWNILPYNLLIWCNKCFFFTTKLVKLNIFWLRVIIEVNLFWD